MAAYVLYRLGCFAAQRVPRLVFALAFGWFSRLKPKTRRLVQAHVAKLAEGSYHGANLRRATTAVFANYGSYWHQLFRLPIEDAAKRKRAFTTTGFEHVRKAAAAGKGVIIALPHMGNWDRAGAWLASMGYPLVVVAETPDSQRLADWFVRQRQAIGIEVVLLGENTQSRVAQELRAGRIVCLLSDRNIGGKGVPVNFFREETVMPGGPALLAMRTGAVLLTAGIYCLPGGKQHIEFNKPLAVCRQGKFADDMQRIMQEVAWQFEILLRRAPEQWLVLQPIWPSDRA